MKNSALSRALTIITLFVIVVAVTASCNKATREDIPANTVDQLVEQAAQQYLNAATPGELPDVYKSTQSGFDCNVKSAATPLTSCLKSVKLTDAQAVQVRKALSAYETSTQATVKAQREELAKLEAAFIAAKKELLAQPVTDKAQRAEIEKKIVALKTELSKAIERVKQSYAEKLSAPYKELITSLSKILDEVRWAIFSKCISR